MRRSRAPACASAAVASRPAAGDARGPSGGGESDASLSQPAIARAASASARRARTGTRDRIAGGKSGPFGRTLRAPWVRALVTGATGFVGGKLTEALADGG